MELCRVCKSPAGEPTYHGEAPAVTSLTTLLNVPTLVFVCKACGHCQSADLPNVREFYNTEYRISLQSEDYDQLYDIVDEKPVYRTDFQAGLMERFASIPKSGAVLDYGAGKAHSLHKLKANNPDIDAHVFDVSQDYAPHWNWIAKDNQATYELPSEWKEKFDFVSAHFVLEHVPDPVAIFCDIAAVLAPKGQFFFTVPDVIGNPGDLIVVDHLNHFTESSLAAALAAAGLEIVSLDRTAFRGAFVLVARKSEDLAAARKGNLQDDVSAAVGLSNYWQLVEKTLQVAAQRFSGRPSAIYGAGVYGTFVTAKIGKSIDLQCFVDRNPHLAGGDLLGRKILPPDQLPTSVEVLYSGLNPRIARSVLPSLPVLKGRSVELVYLD